ncbi:hypothetical protein L195_g045414 [Trifolium pratense]|uniref:Uncharacterized protein n=1 Tax=Trifolium pratense TaxID=57577 RepID=A0A2K3MES3_TRIPR|nr:hypothetical protein L195_g045414 [Trifolium pratense]
MHMNLLVWLLLCGVYGSIETSVSDFMRSLWQNVTETCAQIVDRALQLIEGSIPRQQNSASMTAGRGDNACLSSSVSAPSALACVFAMMKDGLCACKDWITPMCNMDLGEALGLFQAINWVHERQLRSVDFALD